MNWIQSILYGLVSGLAEFLPISAAGHQRLLLELMGVDSSEPVRNLLIHLAVMAALLVCCGTYIEKLRRDRKNTSRGRRRTASYYDSRTVYDGRVIGTAIVPMGILLLLTGLCAGVFDSIIFTAMFFLINGIILYVPEHLPHGNKDARKMAGLDALGIGLFAGLSVLPGVSRVGSAMSFAIGRGADKQKALQWVLVLSIPAIAIGILFDVIGIFSVGLAGITFPAVFGYFCSAVSAFGAACAGIYFIRFFCVRSNLTVFGFYSWGAALLSIIVYLMA